MIMNGRLCSPILQENFLTRGQPCSHPPPSLLASGQQVLPGKRMLSMHWQQSSDSGVTNRGSGNGEVDFTQLMQAFSLEGSESIPTHASQGNAVAPPRTDRKLFHVETHESLLEAARWNSRVPTSSRNQDVGAHPAQEDVDENTLDSSPMTLSSVSHTSEAKPPDTIATFRSSGKVADLCRASSAAFLMHYHDTSAFIGAKGVKINKLRFLSGAKHVNVHTDRTYEVDGRQMVLVLVKGHPDAVHKAVQITEGSYEIFPPPPKATPTGTKPRASPSSSRSGPSKSPRSVGRFPVSSGAPSHLGPVRPSRQQIAVRTPRPAAHDDTTYAAVLSGSNRLKEDVVPVSPSSVLSETEVSAGSESAGQWSGCNLGVEEFCRDQAACIKGSPEAFAGWLRSQDVESLRDLLEAVDDEEFREEMQSNGLKGFKKGAFKKAVQFAVDSQTRSATDDD
jgi:hypothetical protein